MATSKKTCDACRAPIDGQPVPCRCDRSWLCPTCALEPGQCLKCQKISKRRTPTLVDASGAPLVATDSSGQPPPAPAASESGSEPSSDTATESSPAPSDSESPAQEPTEGAQGDDKEPEEKPKPKMVTATLIWEVDGVPWGRDPADLPERMKPVFALAAIQEILQRMEIRPDRLLLAMSQLVYKEREDVDQRFRRMMANLEKYQGMSMKQIGQDFNPSEMRELVKSLSRELK